MSKTLVGIIMGSESDLEVMKEAAQILDKFLIGYGKEQKIKSGSKNYGIGSLKHASWGITADTETKAVHRLA